MSAVPQVLIAFGPDVTCTLDICPIEWSVYTYRPSLPANITLLALFGAVGLVHAYLGHRWRAWGFMVGMLLGCVCEMIGYVGRIMLYNDPFSWIGFMIQIICLTIAPVFFTASIYVTLSKTIIYLAPEASRFRPELFYWVFIPADVICLILQAAGGTLSTQTLGGQTGVDISMAGLVLQLVVILLFIVAFVDYIVRYWRSGGRAGTAAAAVTWRLAAFFAGLSAAIVLILARCCYRVAELNQGYFGELMHEEVSFVVLEGCVIVLAVAALFWGHPGLAFGGRAGRPTE
ncbi:RTA1 like protein [Geosmithia morbida]|uniref:RTA1 like protein n=1 Tax=Geosmithia morbida TaxID=1094350 RepID=A0A9P4YT13_9HYPO|nr:RTA1 like protein [Geosmithia morbida]KAF4121121.1 RTA1 like protein [Geosmithia morbida]